MKHCTWKWYKQHNFSTPPLHQAVPLLYFYLGQWKGGVGVANILPSSCLEMLHPAEGGEE